MAAHICGVNLHSTHYIFIYLSPAVRQRNVFLLTGGFGLRLVIYPGVICSTLRSIIHFAFCNAVRPRSVISPRCSRSAQRCLFSSVQWLLFCRGDKRCANRPSPRRFKVESIQPKQSASSTTSRYGRQMPSGFVLPRYMAIQQHLSDAAWRSNHALNCARSPYSNKSTISIC